MKVCFVAPFNPIPRAGTQDGGHIGGVERYTASLTRALARKGVEVTVVCTGETNEVTLLAGIKIIQRKRLGILMRTPLSAMHRDLFGDFDVIHVPATYPTYSDVMPLIARMRGIPSVLDYHFDVPPFGAAAKALAPIYYAIARKAFARSDAIILKNAGYDTVSRGLRNMRPDIFRVIPNGVDVDAYQPRSEPTRDFVLFVGRLVPFKGVDVLLDAMAKLPPEQRTPIRIAGSGPERPALETRAKALGLDCTFLGYVPEEDLQALYANASVTVLPSRTHQESFGMTLIESMASGTPVIVSDLPGTRYAAEFGGRLFAAGDSDALAGLLRDVRAPAVLSGPRLAEAIRARYSWEAVADQTIALYRDILERRGKLTRQVPVTEPTPAPAPEGRA